MGAPLHVQITFPKWNRCPFNCRCPIFVTQTINVLAVKRHITMVPFLDTLVSLNIFNTNRTCLAIVSTTTNTFLSRIICWVHPSLGWYHRISFAGIFDIPLMIVCHISSIRCIRLRGMSAPRNCGLRSEASKPGIVLTASLSSSPNGTSCSLA